MENDRSRPKNREVEDEMIRPPAREGEPPKSATDAKGSGSPSKGKSQGAAPPGQIREVDQDNADVPDS
ncbi:hypothetical protein EDF56_11313 [Novosphingobium sp. PhB165]|nr:hypothetical protein EDF56_11313 [Novosphingobium sp. PhB165]